MVEAKSVVSTNNLVFLGLETNNVVVIVKVPMLRRFKILSLSQKFTDRKSSTLKQLESFLNKLIFVIKTIGTERAFRRIMHHATICMVNPKGFCRLKQERMLISSYCSILKVQFVFFSEATWSSNLMFDLSIDSSAAQNLGCEAYFQEKCCYFGGSHVGDKYFTDMTIF